MRRRLTPKAMPLHRHSVPQLVIDGVLVAAAYYLAYRLRFDAGIPPRYEDLVTATLPWGVPASLSVFVLFGLYGKHWRYTGQRDYVSILQAVIVATMSVAAIIAIFHPTTVESATGRLGVNLPAGLAALFFLLTLLLVGGARFIALAIHDRPLRGFRPAKDARRVLIIGAGNGGQLVLREILRNPQLRLNPVGFVDDDPLKHGLRFDGVRVLGGTDELGRILDAARPDG